MATPLRVAWSGESAGTWLPPLLDAVDRLPATPGARPLVLCPDASAMAPPAVEEGADLVAVVPDTRRLEFPAHAPELVAGLEPWRDAARALFVPTPTAAARLGPLVSPLPVLPAPLPLPGATRLPAAAGAADGHVLAVGPIDYLLVLDALAALRLGGVERPLVLGAADAAPYATPGGHAARWLLQAGIDVRAVPRWRDALEGAAALVVTDGTDGTGHVLRAALASGLPVVVVAGPLVADHLRACGGRCIVAQPRAVPLAEALAAALVEPRARLLAVAAREAVLRESFEPAARALAGVAAPPPARRPRVRDPRALRVTVVNPEPSGGGGERFLHRLVPALAGEGLAVRLVVPLAPGRAFALAETELATAGVELETPPAHRLDAVVADLGRESDLVYYAWPHLAEAPDLDCPLACTFHDANWRHFFTYAEAEREAADRQTADWIARCARIVCSSRFIRGELVDGFGAPGARVAIVPLTAEAPPAADGAARDAVRARHALPERFVLSPHGHHAHKNYAVLRAALERLRAAGRPVQVVATGAGTEAFHGPDLIGLGYVSGDELAVLYDLALGMVQTTLYEAGSFPLWEAMLARLPAACSDIPPLREQLERQGTQARLFAPLDAADVAAALDELWTRPADAAVLDANERAVRGRVWADVAADYARELRKAARAGR